MHFGISLIENKLLKSSSTAVDIDKSLKGERILWQKCNNLKHPNRLNKPGIIYITYF